MDDIYKELQGVAAGVFREFGQGKISYIAVTPGSGPIDNPGPPVETVTPIDAVARAVSFKFVDGKNVLTTDQQVTMPADTVEPKPNGFVMVDGTRYKIIDVKRKPAAGTPVAWTLIYRK